MTEIDAIVGKLSEAQQTALLALPVPYVGNYLRAARPHSSCWRKVARHYRAFLSLDEIGIVERKESRNETLWRLTRPLGLAVRARLLEG